MNITSHPKNRLYGKIIGGREGGIDSIEKYIDKPTQELKHYADKRKERKWYQQKEQTKNRNCYNEKSKWKEKQLYGLFRGQTRTLHTK